MRRGVRSGIAAIVTASVLSSCAALDISSVPLPGSSYTDGYDVTAEFTNALNLPDRAKVVLDGAEIGVVTNARLAADHVDVTARIDGHVVVPSDIHAVLQQTTVLGDVYLALERRQSTDSSVPPLGPGGRIPVTQTTSPPPLENTLINLSNFIGSGTIQRVQNTVIGINRITPPTPEVRRVVSQVTTDLQGLANNIDTVDILIESTTQTANVAAARTPELTAALSAEGIKAFKRNSVLSAKLATLVPSIGTTFNGGYWLVPALNSLSAALEAGVGAKRVTEEEYPAYRQFVTDYFLSQDKYPAMNITSIIGPDGREMIDNVEQVLRMLGAVP